MISPGEAGTLHAAAKEVQENVCECFRAQAPSSYKPENPSFETRLHRAYMKRAWSHGVVVWTLSGAHSSIGTYLLLMKQA
jgi:hypothetical protein